MLLIDQRFVPRGTSTIMEKPVLSLSRRAVLKSVCAGVGATARISLSGSAASGYPVSVPRLAAQTIDVETVTAQQDGTNLLVTYDTSAGEWELVETHLHIGDAFSDLPTNRSGNPQVGRFDYSGLPDPAPDTVAEYTIDISGMSGDLVIAVHAVVLDEQVIQAAPYSGIEVVDTRQAWRFDGTPVRSQRSNPNAVLSRDFGQNESNFYSLGYGGSLNQDGSGVASYFGEAFEDRRDPAEIKEMEAWISSGFAAQLADTESNAGWIIIRFDPSILNIEDDVDMWVVEDTWGLPYPLELAAVFGKVGETDDWEFICLAHNQEPAPDVTGIIHTVSECELGDLDEAIYILVQDVTDPAWFSGLYPAQAATLDGYDLNTVEALQDHVEHRDETAWGAGSRFVDRGNWATYFEYDLDN